MRIGLARLFRRELADHHRQLFLAGHRGQHQRGAAIGGERRIVPVVGAGGGAEQQRRGEREGGGGEPGHCHAARAGATVTVRLTRRPSRVTVRSSVAPPTATGPV